MLLIYNIICNICYDNYIISVTDTFIFSPNYLDLCVCVRHTVRVCDSECHLLGTRDCR